MSGFRRFRWLRLGLAKLPGGTQGRFQQGFCRESDGRVGTAEEKIPALIQDISAWPIPGLVVFGGDGFSTNTRSYLHSMGKAVAFEDLESWLRLFFVCLKASASRGSHDPVAQPEVPLGSFLRLSYVSQCPKDCTLPCTQYSRPSSDAP